MRVFEAADFRCERCGSTDQQLHAHHKLYLKGRKPWEYDRRLLECLCDDCHRRAHEEQEQLALIVAQQPTAQIPHLTDALLTAIYEPDPPADMHPRMRSLFDKIGKAMTTGATDDFIHAQNALQDLRDERADIARGEGGN